jgi:hypothetical protein
MERTIKLGWLRTYAKTAYSRALSTAVAGPSRLWDTHSPCNLLGVNHFMIVR